jgi:hypothetical protein
VDVRATAGLETRATFDAPAIPSTERRCRRWDSSRPSGVKTRHRFWRYSAPFDCAQGRLELVPFRTSASSWSFSANFEVVAC